MSAQPEHVYLDAGGVAARIGVKRESVWEYVRRGDMPDADIIWLGHKLWLPETIDAWRAQRYQRRHKRMPLARVDVAPPSRPPRVVPRAGAAAAPKQPKAMRKRTRAGASEKPAVTTVSEQVAREVAAELRAQGFTCMSADVMVLADYEGEPLEHDRELLRQRIRRRLDARRPKGAT